MGLTLFVATGRLAGKDNNHNLKNKTMKTLKITPGRWVAIEAPNNEYRIISTFVGGPFRIAKLTAYFIDEQPESHLEANAQLIAEAGTVANETGLTPRELLEQRNELLEELKTAYRFCAHLADKLPASAWRDALEAGIIKMRQTIENSEA